MVVHLPVYKLKGDPIRLQIRISLETAMHIKIKKNKHLEKLPSFAGARPTGNPFKLRSLQNHAFSRRQHLAGFGRLY